MEHRIYDVRFFYHKVRRNLVYFVSTAFRLRFEFDASSFIVYKANYFIFLILITKRWTDISTVLNTPLPKKDKDKNALREKHLAEFNTITIEELKMLRDFLEPLKNGSDELEASKHPTLHLVHAWYHAILVHFQPNLMDTTMIANMKVTGLAYWTNNVQKHITDFHNVAVCLHPEMKDLRLYTEQERTRVWSKVDELMDHFSPQIESRNGTYRSTIQSKKRIVSKAMEYFINNRNDDETPQRSELDEYKYLKVGEVDSLLQWWEDNKLRFPKLYGVARFIHAIPASSAAAERLFSKAGRVVTFRPNMKASLVDELLFLKSNIDMFNKLKTTCEESNIDIENENENENAPESVETHEEEFVIYESSSDSEVEH